MHEPDVSANLRRAFAQPLDQNVPQDLMRLLVELDRNHRETSPSPLRSRS